MSDTQAHPITEATKVVSSKYVRTLRPGTELTAVNDEGKSVTGIIHEYRHVQYTLDTGATYYEVEYRVKWDDGIHEWITWSEVDLYNPVRVLGPSRYHATNPRSTPQLVS